MAEEKHIIRKAIVEVHVASQRNAFKIQNQASAFFKEKILPLIEKIIDEMNLSEQVIRIEKLELDIHQFKPDDSHEKVLMELEEQILGKLIKIKEEVKRDVFDGEPRSLLKKGPQKEADEELFLHLLKSGTLPWWAKTETTISIKTLAKQVLEKPSEGMKKELLASLRMPSVRKRIAFKLDSGEIEKIIGLVENKSPQLLRNIRLLIEFLKINWRGPEFFETVSGKIYEHALTSRSSSDIDLRAFISTFLMENAHISIAETLYKTCLGLSKESGLTNDVAISIRQGLADADPRFAGGIKKIFSVTDIKKFFSAEIKKEPTSSDKNKEEGKTKIFKVEELELAPLAPEQTGDYFITNAGMILIAPFLPAFFKEFNLTDGKIFLTSAAAERAVFLLQYLSTGVEDSFEEHDMVLSKVLCGVDIDEPLTLDFKLTKAEKEETLNLLNAVAGHWTALKGTTGESMRAAFFKRDGILEQQSNGWNLKIEKMTIDILLDKLPWGISILQTPWSEEMIFVDW